MKLLTRLRRWFGLAPRHPRIAPEQWTQVEATLPFLDYLPPADRPRLRELALEFLAQKEFHAAAGFRLTDDILLSIALQACVLILKRGLRVYQGWLGVVIYPDGFILPQRWRDAAGVVHEQAATVLGATHADGPVLLSWPQEAATAPARTGANVVIHEFAHKLDMANGPVDGFPSLSSDMSRSAWAAAFSPAYEALRRAVEDGVTTFIDPYAATDPGEFFAVVSEVFFQQPLQLQSIFPAVHEQLALLYGVDPAIRAAQFEVLP